MTIRSKRILAGLIDHAVCCIIGTIIGKAVLSLTHMQILTEIVYYIVYVVSLSLKDIIYINASIGKRLFDLKIVTNDSHKIGLMIHLKRALPMLIIPLEIFLIIANGKRIGDIWAKTIVTDNHGDKEDTRGRFS